MPRARSIPALLAFGFFPIFAQALLLRDFLAAFEGYELAIGCFYSSWLFGLAAGGGAARALGTGSARASFPALLLLYVPVFLLQECALLRLRAWAGIERYEVFPIGRVAAWSFLVNLPLSALTGWLFPRACRELASGDLPLARVYALESLGAFAGGASATVLLACGRAPAWCAAAGFAIAAAPFATGTARRPLRAAVALAAIALLAGSGAWQEQMDRWQWRRVLPQAVPQGSFETRQARYLVGAYGPQINVLEGETIVESFPEAEHAATVAALHLAQLPDARRTLLIGPGLALAEELPGEVEWMHPDPGFARRLLLRAEIHLRKTPGLPAGDPRAFLAAHPGRYDLILVNLPSAHSLALNRFITREGLAAARTALASNGVLSVCARGGENYLGPELALLGASLQHNLAGLFAQVVIKPGEETWLLASDRPDLTADRADLLRRYGQLPAERRPIPAESLAALWPPDRVAEQGARYRQAQREADPALLVNTDAHPRALLHALLVATRESGSGARWPWFVRGFVRAGAGITLAALGLFAALWLAYARRGDAAPCAPLLLAATTGAAGMAVSVLLMCAFQARFGSLAVHSGLLSALFMLGLAIGGRLRVRPGWLLALHAIFLAALAALPTPAHVSLFAALLFGAGLMTGAYVPAVAAALHARRDEAGAALFIAADNLAGAAAGLLVGLLFIPALGLATTTALLIPLVGVNVVGLLRPAPARRDGFRAAGYAGLGAAAGLLIASHLLHAAEPSGRAPSFDDAARSLAAEAKWKLGAKDESGSWIATADDGQPAGRIMDTSSLAPDVQGYGGPLSLALLVSTNQALHGAQVLVSHETPSYQGRVERWLRELVARHPDRSVLAGVDGVTGATLTSDAVIALLRTSMDRLAGGAQEKPAAKAVEPGPSALAALLAAALLVFFRPGRWRRRVLLLAALGCGGLWLNTQYSLDHVFALLGLHIPNPGFTVPFLLVAGVPLLVLLFGNVYCGYLCPFGALQELLGEWTSRFDPDKESGRWARAVKFALLALALAWFSIDLLRERAEIDPLVSVFSAGTWRRPSALAVLALVGALFFRRFWCRTLCPAGALLSVLGALRPLRRWLPAVQPSLCDLGVRTARDADCLQCGRCRVHGARSPAPAHGPWPGLLALAVAAGIALFVAGARQLDARLAPADAAAAGTTGEGFTRGQPANEPALRALMQQGRLSSREAMYYRPYEGER